MSRVTWGDPGTRFYETGVDRGVLYVNNEGVAWNGLTTISESPTGGDPKPYYMDGIKYLNIAGSEEYAATLEALTAPAEFGPCDGTQSLNKGLFVTQQPRKAFGLSYRTLVGNDLQAQNLGYKIHLVYNALAAPTERSYTSFGASTDPTSLSWSLTTLPPSLTGMKPTAHFVIDSRSTPKMLLKAIEDILYGSDAADARMPLVSELLTMFESQGPLTRRNLTRNPSYRVLGTANTEIRRNYIFDPRFVAGTGWANVTANGVAGGAITPSNGFYSPWQSAVAGEMWSVSVQLTAPAGAALTGTISARPTTGGSFGANAFTSTAFTIPAGMTARVFDSEVIPAGADGLRLQVASMSASNIAIDKAVIEKNPMALPYMDGATVADDGLSYSWTGTVNNSHSIATGTGTPANSFRGYTRFSWLGIGSAEDGTNTTMCYVGSSSAGTTANSLVLWGSDIPAASVDDQVSARFRVRLRKATTSLTLFPRLYAYTAGGAGIAAISGGPNVVVPATGEWVDVVIPAGICPATTGSARLYVTAISNQYIDAIVEVSKVLVEHSSYDEPGFYFDGSSPDVDNYFYVWEGAADASISIENTWN